MVGVRVSSHEKKKFEEFLETEEGQRHNSIADMMRTTAHNEINNAGESELNADEIINAVEIALSDVTEELDSLNTQMTVIKDSISDDKDIQELAAEIYEYLPKHDIDPFDFGIEHWDPDLQQEEYELGIPDESNFSVNSSEDLKEWPTVDAFAEYLDEPRADVQRALSWAKEYYPDVKEQEPPVKTDLLKSRYYRVKR